MTAQEVEDLAGTPQQQRWARAARVKALQRVNLPRLADWNYDACDRHDRPTAMCEYRACGGDFFDHQTRSVTFHYAAKKSLDGSATGTGKTNSLLGLLCLCKHRGETLRCVLVVPTSAVKQWAAETRRFAPGLRAMAITSGTTRSERMRIYSAQPEVLIIGFHVLHRDIDVLTRWSPLQVISDDVDPLLQPGNATAKAILRLARDADRCVVANATPLQVRLEQLYATSLPIGGREVWGSMTSFQTRYLKKEPVYIYTTSQRGGRTERKRQKVQKTTGYKALGDFKAKYEPMGIRHRYEDLEGDLSIPPIMVQHVYVDMHPAQRERYQRLQEGVLELQRKDMPPQQKQVSAVTAWTHGGQICAGLPALGEEDGPGASSKMDWVVEHVAGEWADQKIVVYCRNVGTIAALQARLDARRVGHATIWGQDANADHRAEEIRRFWEDPTCRIMLLTSAGERGLNLQVASILIMVDLNLNPARNAQLMGRIRRAGSQHRRLLAVMLMCNNSQEERYQVSLAARQHLFDRVHDEDNSEVYEALPAETLLRLISP